MLIDQTTPFAQLAKKPAPESRMTPEELGAIKKTAKEFEAMFMSEMFKHMFEGMDVNPQFGGGQGEKVWQGMIVEEYGKMVAKTPQGLGLSDMIQKQMIMMQSSAR